MKMYILHGAIILCCIGALTNKAQTTFQEYDEYTVQESPENARPQKQSEVGYPALFSQKKRTPPDISARAYSIRQKHQKEEQATKPTYPMYPVKKLKKQKEKRSKQLKWNY